MMTTSKHNQAVRTRPATSDMILAATRSSPNLANSKIPSYVPVEDIVSERQSTREALRAKLREQEKRLSSLVRTSNTHSTTLGAAIVTEREVAAAANAATLAELKTVQAKLAVMEKDKAELAMEMERMKEVMKEAEAIKANYADMDERFEHRLKKNNCLKKELFEKDGEIELLRTELANKLQRIVELEFELETHELNYTNYADELFKLGEDALEEIKGTNGDNDLTPQGNDGSSPKKAKRLISKLLVDLDDLEIRYKDDKLKSSTLIEELRMENTELKTQVQVLEQKLGLLSPTSEKYAHDAKMEIDDSDDEGDAGLLKSRRVEKLEAKNALYRKEMAHLKAELAEARRDAQADAHRAEHHSTRLQNEVYALKAHLEQLEVKHKWGGGNKKKQKGQAAEQYAAIEKRIEDNYNQVLRLQNELDIKERQLSALKTEVTDLRKKDIADGNTKDCTETDSELLRDESMQAKRSFESDRTGTTRATDYSYSLTDL